MKRRSIPMLMAVVMVLLLLPVWLLAACAAPKLTLDPEELYALPELPARYTALNQQLSTIQESGAEYAAPVSGSNIQPVQMVDLDGDGVEELVVFAPFHGQTLQIYRKTDGAYRCVFEKDGMGFLHAIWGGMLCGRPAALVGHRDGKRALYLLTWEDGDYRMTCIDENLGPANAAVIQMRTGQGIVAANCETGTVTLYTPR